MSFNINFLFFLGSFLFFMMSSCTPKSQSDDIGDLKADTPKECLNSLSQALEAESDFALSHSNHDAKSLTPSTPSGSMAVTSLGASSGFGLTVSGTSGVTTNFITYAINPIGSEEFYRIKLCDAESCQCYSQKCQGEFSKCKELARCSSKGPQGQNHPSFWIKTNDSVNSVPSLGLNGSVDLAVKHCGYNYMRSPDYPGGGGSFRKEVCGSPQQSVNRIDLSSSASFALTGEPASSAQKLAQRRIEALASKKRIKEEECFDLMDHFSAKAAFYLGKNKKRCEGVDGKAPDEQGPCLVLESVAGKISDFKPLLCSQDAFYDISFLLSSGMIGTDDSAGSSFSLSSSKKASFYLASDEEIESAACETVGSIESFSDDSSSPSAGAFSDFFSDPSFLNDPYEAPLDEISSPVIVTSDPSGSGSVAEDLSQTLYGNTESEDPPVFDPGSGEDVLEDPNFSSSEMTKEEKMGIFMLCTGVFAVAGIATAVSLFKTLGTKQSLGEAEFNKIAIGDFDNVEGDFDSKGLRNFKDVIGNDGYKGFFGDGKVIDEKVSLMPKGESGFHTVKRSGLFGEFMTFEGSFDKADILKPKMIKGAGGKFRAGFDINLEMAKAFKIDVELENAGFNLDSETGKYVENVELGEVDYDSKFSSKGMTDLKMNALDAKIKDMDLGDKLDVSFKAKTKVGAMDGFKKGLGFAAMAGALGGVIFASSEGAFELTSSESESGPIKRFVDNLFGDFFVNQILPNTSKAYCYGKNLEEINHDISKGYYSDSQFTSCVYEEMRARGDYLKSLFSAP